MEISRLWFVLAFVHLVCMSYGCGELWINCAQMEGVSGTWSLYHEQRNDRPSFRRVSLEAGRRTSPLYLYHTVNGYWVIGDTKGGVPIVSVQSYALSPLMISSLDPHATWQSSSAVSDVTCPLDISCHMKPMSFYLFSGINPHISGVFIPTGRRSSHAHVYQRLGRGGKGGKGGDLLTIRYIVEDADDLEYTSSRSRPPRLTKGRGRWEVISRLGDVQAYVQVEAEEQTEEQVEEDEEKFQDLRPHLDQLSAPRHQHISEELDRPPPSLPAHRWMVLRGDAEWLMDTSVAVDLIYETVERRHKQVPPGRLASQGALISASAYSELREKLSGSLHPDQGSCVVLARGYCMPTVGFNAGGLHGIRSLVAALTVGYRLVNVVHSDVEEELARMGSVLQLARERLWSTHGPSAVWISLEMVSEESEIETYFGMLGTLSTVNIPHASLLFLQVPRSRGQVNNWMGAWRIMERLFEEGKALCLGVSRFDLNSDQDWHYEWLQELLLFAKIKPEVVQGDLDPFSFKHRYPPALSLCKAHGIVFQATSLLRRASVKDVNGIDESALIDGYIVPDNLVSDRFEYLEVRKELAAMAVSVGRSAFQVLIKWCLEVVGTELKTAVVLSSSSLVHLKSDLDMDHWSLSSLGPILAAPYQGTMSHTDELTREKTNQQRPALSELRSDVLASKVNHAIAVAEAQRNAVKTARAARTAAKATAASMLSDLLAMQPGITRWARWQRILVPVLLVLSAAAWWSYNASQVPPPLHAGLGSPLSPARSALLRLPRRQHMRSQSAGLPTESSFSLASSIHLDQAGGDGLVRPREHALSADLDQSLEPLNGLSHSFNRSFMAVKSKEW